MWYLESLGIGIGNSEVYDEFVDSISFNGSRYSVKLPRKEGHPVLPDNYKLSSSRLNSQLRKLRKEPEVLKEYDTLIQEQLQKGIIEKVASLEESDKTHYIPHLGVIPDRQKRPN